MVNYLFGSLIAVLAGFLLDLLFGDPDTPIHPVRLIGRLIDFLEKLIRRAFPKNNSGERTGGTLLAILVVLIPSVFSMAILVICYKIAYPLGFIAEALLCFSLFAMKSLRKESINVKKEMEERGLEAGRMAVSRIVGRDTGTLSEKGITRATVETVAENFSDGVIAPMFYMMIGGPVLGFAYKSINTLDSMVGYKNDSYLQFGRFSAKLDDLVNFIPSRLAALALILTAPFVGLDGKNALKIWKRDRFKHASPNSAQTESAAAGALHVQLAGDAYYFGVLYKKPFIGDNDRSIETNDIIKMNRLMTTASAVALLIFSLIKFFFILIIKLFL